MKPEIAPTSSKRKVSAPVAEVWQHGSIQQPQRTPWGRIVLVIVAMSLLIGLGLIAGAVWVQRYGPTGWWTRWLPVVTTTVVQQSTARPASDAPKAVRELAESLVGLTSTSSENTSYGQEDFLGAGVPLSDNGWLVTLQRPPAADGSPVLALPLQQAPLALTAWVADPSSPFVFAKGLSFEASPATLGDIANSLNQPVWVINRVIKDQEIVQRRVIGSQIPAWPTSDRLERTYRLDVPVNTADGAVVATPSGQVIGLIATDGQVWPVSSLQPLLKSLIQTGQIERTSLGIRARRRDELIVTGEPTAAGWLIGAGSDQAAVTEDSPAARAGLKTGDSILAIDGKKAEGDIFDVLQHWQPGETTTLTIQRNASERAVTVQFSSLRP